MRSGNVIVAGYVKKLYQISLAVPHDELSGLIDWFRKRPSVVYVANDVAVTGYVHVTVHEKSAHDARNKVFTLLQKYTEERAAAAPTVTTGA